MSNLNNPKYVKIFANKNQLGVKRMSNSNSATDFVKKTFDTRGTTNSIASTHRDIIHPSIQRVTQNENKIQKSPSQVDWTTISSPRYVQYDSPRDTKNMVKKLKGYQY